MRLIQNMCTIAEYPAPGSASAADCCLGAAGRRLVKIAVVGASGVGKTGESSRSGVGGRVVPGQYVGDPCRDLWINQAWGKVGCNWTALPPSPWGCFNR